MKKKYIMIILLSIILVALVLLFIDKSTYKEYSKNYFYMDTYINIKINTIKSKAEMDSIFEDIDYLYSSYNKLSDRYNEYDNIKNIYYLNEILNDGEQVQIDSRLSDIISLGIEYYDKTNGLFNIASGNLTIVWKNFIDTCDILPSTKDLDINVDINDIVLEDNYYTKYNGVKLDLGGITKGYVTELVGNYLEDNGIYSYIINAGGNVKVGKAYNKEFYVVGITDPDNTKEIFTKVNVNNKSIVTSGNYQRYCVLEDKIYSHIIDPKLKYPSSYMKSVTVISDSSIIGDIYSTYLYMLPVEEGLKKVNSISDIDAIWYISLDNIVRSDGFSYE